MNRYIISEDVEITLDGKKYLLEKGDTIVVEGLLDAIKSAGGILKGVAEQFGEKTAEKLAKLAEDNPELSEKLKDAIKNRKENIVNSIIDKISGKKSEKKISPEQVVDYFDKWAGIVSQKNPRVIIKAVDILNDAGFNFPTAK
jgi:hypothetical protein